MTDFPLIEARGRRRWLDADGLHPRIEDCRRAIDPEQVATAKAFLARTTRQRCISAKSAGSYGLKHSAERWGRRNGRAPYVSNGALIRAAIELGIPVVPDQPVDSPNAAVGVSRARVARLELADRDGEILAGLRRLGAPTTPGQKVTCSMLSEVRILPSASTRSPSVSETAALATALSRERGDETVVAPADVVDAARLAGVPCRVDRWGFATHVGISRRSAMRLIVEAERTGGAVR